MLPEVQHAGIDHCGGLLRHIPGDGCYGRDGYGGRTPRPSFQLDMERRAEAQQEMNGVGVAMVLPPLHHLQGPGKAIFAEAAIFDVDPFHRVRRRHGALIVVTVS